MEVKELEVYSETSNYGIVRMPGRNFPGAVIQGDSLSILCNHARWIFNRVKKKGNDKQLIDAADELLELLEGRLQHYEKTLADHKMELPYVKVSK